MLQSSTIMGFKGSIPGLVPDKLKPPLKPASYSEFQDVLMAQNARTVTAIPGRRAIGHEVQTYSGTSATDWMYYVAFTGVSSQGRRIVFEQACANRRSMDDTENDFGGRAVGARMILSLEAAWSLTTCVTADVLLQELKKQMPQCETVLMDDGQNPFTEDQYRELRSEAEVRHIRPWDQE